MPEEMKLFPQKPTAKFRFDFPYSTMFISKLYYFHFTKHYLFQHILHSTETDIDSYRMNSILRHSCMKLPLSLAKVSSQNEK